MYVFVHTDHRITCISVNVVGWELLFLYIHTVDHRITCISVNVVG